MLRLTDHIREEKNVHMEHLEDLIFNEGVSGTRRAINFLIDLRNMLAGHAKSKVTATVKWDGAPAIFAGIDPSDGKFFVAKKGVFNKNPKVYKTNADIDADLSGELNTKFKVALKELSKLGITDGVYQGDLMFTRGDLKSETIEGESYITFHPNTIVYAIPADSDLARKIKAANMGIVWHTAYSGGSLETMHATFGTSIVSKFKSSSTVWMDDATYKDYTGVATFTAAETERVTSLLRTAGRLFRSIPSDTIDGISKNSELLMLVKTYNNSQIREGNKIKSPSAHVKGLLDFIFARYSKEMEAKKTTKGKLASEQKRNAILQYFRDHKKDDIVKIFELANILTDAKEMIVSKMNEAGGISTFLKTSNGFKATGVEGFVAIDKLSGGAVKIVNRMEFSRANFSADIVKGWQR
jgi:hypothetical protein